MVLSQKGSTDTACLRGNPYGALTRVSLRCVGQLWVIKEEGGELPLSAPKSFSRFVEVLYCSWWLLCTH